VRNEKIKNAFDDKNIDVAKLILSAIYGIVIQ